MRGALLLILCLVPVQLLAGGPCSGVKGGCGRGSSYRTSSPTGVVHVSGYVRKDGTYVAPYDRTRADGDPSNNFSAHVSSKSIEAESDAIGRGTAYRSKARSGVRTAAWGGTGSSRDEDDAEKKLRMAPAPVEREEHGMRTWHSGNHTIQARFVSMSSGKVKLHTIDDRDIAIDFEKLSAEDQKWIERLR